MRWLRRIGHKPLVEKRLDSELQFHLEQQIADYIASGISPEEARRRANLEFGGVERFKEECRESRWENQLDIFLRDFHFAVRGLLKDRRFAFVSIFALALAIGASTAMFSVVENALFEPFPYKDQRKLVAVHIRDLDQEDNYRSFFTMPEIEEIRKQNNVFEDTASNQQDDIVQMDTDTSLRLDGNFVTPGSFDFLGVPALLGRSLADADYQPGAPPVFVLRYKAWQGKFNSDPSCNWQNLYVKRCRSHPRWRYASALCLGRRGSLDTVQLRSRANSHKRPIRSLLGIRGASEIRRFAKGSVGRHDAYRQAAGDTLPKGVSQTF